MAEKISKGEKEKDTEIKIKIEIETESKANRSKGTACSRMAVWSVCLKCDIELLFL